MVRFVGSDAPPPRRNNRHFRHDDIPTDTFTPRNYQVELLQSALQGNTVACLGSGSSKVFLGLMVIKQMSHQIRIPFQDGGKRSVYLAESDADVDSLWSTLYHHTDLAVGRVEDGENGNSWTSEQWMSTFASSNVLVLSSNVFAHCLDHAYLPLSQINLIVVDECHKAVADHPYVGIMSHVGNLGDSVPHLLCLTASILGTEGGNPAELADRISNLETTLHAKAETSMLVISERFGCRPKESVIECEGDSDVTGMTERLGAILYQTWHFLEDCQFKPEDHSGRSDPLHVPKFAISECINILQTLGSWCAASIAENLISQLDKIVKHENNQMMKLFIRYTITQLRLVMREFELGFTPEYEVDELLNYTTPKVRELVRVLRNYKPEMDFMIITREGEGGDSMSDLSDDDGGDDDDDSLDLSGSDDDDSGGSGGKSKSGKHIHIAVKRKVEKSDSEGILEEDRKLSGLVFVDNRYVAFALNKMLEEVCAWDENLCFVKSSYITGQGIHRSDGRKDMSNASRKQEEILRKFRMQERNLLVTTSVLEEGVDIPKCNLVVRFDPPTDYRSYALCKGRARARDSAYVILVDEELMEDFSDEIEVFKGTEQVLIGAGRGRQDLEDAKEVQQLDQIKFTPLPAFCPLNQPGAATVSMKNSIALINRYCAKLPSDAFTHLTPQCRVCPAPSDASQYVAYLRLPVNSPIKEELQGAVMPSRQLAKMAVALEMCQLLHRKGELDDNLQPVGKEMFLMEEEEQDQELEGEEEEGVSQARPGTTKRKQYYIKKLADAFVKSHPKAGQVAYLYHVTMTLTGPITEDQNTRGRKLYAPEDSTQSFGILLSSQIPNVPSFPVYTRSGEVTVHVELLRAAAYSEEELQRLTDFHHFVFASVLHLEKDPMVFLPESSEIGFLIVPLNGHEGSEKLGIEWNFVEKVSSKTVHQRRNVFDGDREVFQFVKEDFEDAVVMPSYRNIDQPQHFYVAEIRSDLSPLSPFPSPELYKTFAAYYTTKYGLTLTNMEQPLLDVDHTSARLNLLTPRYMNQKGRALPTSSVETKRARRENLQQKQILVPELCDIHVFSASLWRKAVCLPAILYRINYLMLAEELRTLIAAQTGIGKVQLEDGFRFPRLDFGFETNPEKVQAATQKEAENQSNEDSGNGKTTSESPETCDKKKTEMVSGKIEEEEQKEAVSPAVRDLSPEDDKTDTGASSDSDSGVAMSESDTCISSKLVSGDNSNPVTHPTDHQVTTASVHHDVDGSGTVVPQTENCKSSSDVQGASVTVHDENSPVSNPTFPSAKTLADDTSSTTDQASSAVLPHAETCQDDAQFTTPPSSRPASPANSDISMYEDAGEEFAAEDQDITKSKEMNVVSSGVNENEHFASEMGTPKGGLPSDVENVCQTCNDPTFALNHKCVPSITRSLPSSSSNTSSTCVSPRLPLLNATDVLPLSPPLETATDTTPPPQSPTTDKEETSAANICLPTSSSESTTFSSDSCSRSVPDHAVDISADNLNASHDTLPSKNSLNSQCAISNDLKTSKSEFAAVSSVSLKDQLSQSAVNSKTLENEEPLLRQNSSTALPKQGSTLPQTCLVNGEREACDSNSEKLRGEDEGKQADKDIDEKLEEEKVPKKEKVLIEDCDDFLDVTGTNRNDDDSHKTGTTNHTITFPADPHIAKFVLPEEEVKLTFESSKNVGHIDLDDTWSQSTATGISSKEWAPDESLTTFEVNGTGLSEEWTDNTDEADSSSSANTAAKDAAETKSEDADLGTNDTSAEKKQPSLNQNQPQQGESSQKPVQNHTKQVKINDTIEGKTDLNSENGGTNLKDKKETGLKPENGINLKMELKAKAEETEGWGEEQARNPSEWINGSPKKQLLKENTDDTEVSSKNCAQNSSLSACDHKANDGKATDKSISDCNAKCGNEKTVNGFEKKQSLLDTPAAEKVDTNNSAKAMDSSFEISTWTTQTQKVSNEKRESNTCPREVEGQAKEESTLPLLSLDHDTDLATFAGPSPCLLLQALTMSNANDFFSLERLETIGDSYLKYAITVYLYCMYPGIHEGKLSYLRSKQVSNYNLYRLGRRKGLAERMVSTKFEPYENWLPPGYVINEDRRRGPVPKVVIATCNPKLSAAASVNFLIEEESDAEVEGQKRETEAFQAEVEEIDRQQEVDQQIDLSAAHSHRHAMVPYCLQLHHGIPDKSVADCVEALIGCYLTTSGKQAALTFMSWLGLKVLPRKRVIVKRKGEEVKKMVAQELQCPPSPLLRSVPEAPALLSRLLEGFEEFERKIEYNFRDRSYLLQAFTHASYHYNYITDCYQRLEFLGDAILDYVITRHLYEDSQRYSPGILTDLRSALVNNNIFAALAVKWDFHKFFKALSPSLFIVIDKFVVRQKEREDQIDELEEVKTKQKQKRETDEEDDADDPAEGAASAATEAVADNSEPISEDMLDREDDVELEIPKALGDIFESVAGAIYLDSGMSLDAVWRVYYRMMKPHIDKYLKDIPKSPVRELLEMEPETAKFEKPERTLEGKIRVMVNVVGKGVFYGVGRNYRIAKSAAAKKALRFIRNLQTEAQA